MNVEDIRERENIPSIAGDIIAECTGVVAGGADIVALLAPARIFEDPAYLFDLGALSDGIAVYQIGWDEQDQAKVNAFPYPKVIPVMPRHFPPILRRGRPVS